MINTIFSQDQSEEDLLEKPMEKIYTKFKLFFYQNIFENFENREATLTTVETFCMEVIHSLGRPTVAEFSQTANISPQNAAYKINNLVKKGYLRKVRSETDKREYFLEVTDKYLNYYRIGLGYRTTVMNRIEKRFKPEEVAVFKHIIEVTAEELMPEVS